MKDLIKRVRNYLADVWAEMKKVSWVQRKELLTTTLVVILFSTVLALFIGVVDFVFSRLLGIVLR
ncbi:preprotein translocase subunit SecE [candidate division WOR-3 bacterium]|uniref:Protein translocase subunit SecE n=1 Tax=candidate division WOR-3 bacterium TaxID=2052148 RepID=A0A938BTN9_UNCW3|nr:preprotein translocase subunit SecE [candidate division WOR-3 bacterium]